VHPDIDIIPSFPSSCLGGMAKKIDDSLAKQELGLQWVPKQELGNQSFMFQGNTQNHEN
jgi:hypothetical protein